MSEKKKTVVACTLLGLGLVLTVPQFLPGGADAVIEEGEQFEEEEPQADATASAWGLEEGGGDAAPAPAGPRLDLVAAFGSWAASRAVKPAFAGPAVEEEPVDGPPTHADDGEPAFVPDPPAHHVTLVLRSGGGERAVVDERVVRVGGSLAAGVITAIHAGGIVVEGPFGRLEYELGAAGAVGYRPGEREPLAGATGADGSGPRGPDGLDGDDFEDFDDEEPADWEQTLDAVLYGDVPEDEVLDALLQDVDVNGLTAGGDDG